MKYLLSVLSVMSALSIFAQKDTSKAVATMSTATIYYGYGAELTHKTTLSVTKDTRFIVIDKLSTQMDINSLQISCPETVSLLAQQFTTYQNEVKPKPVNVSVKKQQDTIKQLYKLIAQITNKISIEELTLSKTEKMIEATINTSGNKTALTAEVLKLIDYYNAKAERNKKIIFEYKEQIDEQHQKIGEINERISIISAGENTEPEPENVKQYGRVIMQVICRNTQEVPVSLSYYTNNAGWQPMYDLRVNSANNSIKLMYKANVTQNTGIDWKQAKLTLSTGTPSFTTTAPTLSAWYLQYYVPELYKSLSGVTSGLAPAMNNDFKFNRNVLTDKDGNINEVNEKSEEPTTLEQYTTLRQGLLNTNFEIDLPYDILSNGMAHSINIKEELLQSNLKNYAVPKLDREAYLLGELTNWQNLDLLPGNANIIMDDTYIGRSFIDPNTTADTLNLSLGKDKRVAVKRALIKDATTTKKKDNFTIQTFTYELTVKNNKQKELAMLLKDQMPLSNIAEIEIKLEDDGGAIVNEELGILTWKLNLKPGEVKKYRFKYTIKFPKDKKIANLK